MIIKYIVMHHTQDITPGDQFAKTKRYHMQDLGWRDIAYHYLIEKNGQVRPGRAEQTKGAHARGYNSVSIGVALAGDFTKEKPTAAQIASTLVLIKQLKVKYPAAKIVGHKELNNTDCPGSLDVKALATQVAAPSAQPVAYNASEIIVPLQPGTSEKAAAIAVISFGLIMLKKLL